MIVRVGLPSVVIVREEEGAAGGDLTGFTRSPEVPTACAAGPILLPSGGRRGNPRSVRRCFLSGPATVPLREVLPLAPITPTPLTRWIREQRFPPPLNPHSSKRVWSRADVQAWLENRWV